MELTNTIPTVKPGQSLYIGRPHSRDWREALKDHWEVMAGGAPKSVWVVPEWTFKKGDILVTYMQTRPSMVVFVDRFTEDAAEWQDYIPSDTLALFKHGIPLGVVAEHTGIDLSQRFKLDESEARAVLKVLRREHKADVGVFGDSRMADLI
ncbi:hypothetical protein ACFWAD_17285 [Rhodococcus sp. NPDC059969]|uniref:hypothetical protein n=1 Tax=Rhodococcus sp. NPDC059969 TaxID=3347018 RepID=UPI00366B3564